MVAAVPDDAWGAPTPCGEWTVRQVLNHARIDQQGYGLAITGVRPDSDPFALADALDGDPAAELDKVLRAVADAYAGLPADTGQVPTPLGPLPQRLAEGIRPAADRLVDRLRDAYQVFAPAREVSQDHDTAEALLAFLGRAPHWTPWTPTRTCASGRWARPERVRYRDYVIDLRSVASPAPEWLDVKRTVRYVGTDCPGPDFHSALGRSHDVLIHLHRVEAARLRDR